MTTFVRTLMTLVFAFALAGVIAEAAKAEASVEAEASIRGGGTLTAKTGELYAETRTCTQPGTVTETTELQCVPEWRLTDASGMASTMSPFTMTITATPAAGWEFASWATCPDAAGNTCRVSTGWGFVHMTAKGTAVASFRPVAQATPAPPATTAPAPAPTETTRSITGPPPFTVFYTFRKGRFTRLTWTDNGSKVKVTVKCPRRKGCPKPSKIVGKRLQRGTRITPARRRRDAHADDHLQGRPGAIIRPTVFIEMEELACPTRGRSKARTT
jgi:hypothetical protein